MYGVRLYEQIKTAVFLEGMSRREASRRFGVHRETVKKALKRCVSAKRSLPAHYTDKGRPAQDSNGDHRCHWQWIGVQKRSASRCLDWACSKTVLQWRSHDADVSIEARQPTFAQSLVDGARAVVRTAPNKTDPNNQWVNQLRERRGFNRSTVAVANKNARIIWTVLCKGEPYRAAF